MQLQGIADFFVGGGWVQKEDAIAYVEASNKNKTSFLDELVKSKKYDCADIAASLSEMTGYPFFDLNAWELSTDFQGRDFDKKPFEEACAIPLWKKGNTLLIGVSDTFSEARYKNIKFAYSNIEMVVVEHDKLLQALKSFGQTTSQKLEELTSDVVLMDNFGAPPEEEEVHDDDVDDSPVAKLLQKTLLDAIGMGASDLHFEPFEHKYQIRFRVDGNMIVYMEPPVHIKDKIASVIKVQSKMDITEKRVPQDGRMSFIVGAGKKIDFRVNSCPVVRGEKIVMRILDPNSVKVSIDSLGYDPDQKEKLLHAVKRPYGMVLVTGPTGSGKTVSLYTCLNILNTPEVNISTAEDPAEIDLPGINQVNVNDKQGLTFSAALKAFLRQDPDIIMVGEIRDLETAEISIKASQTGHMVLSTLHTNSAPETITRLISMGIPAFNVASSVSLITAQRLARRLCSCKKEVTYEDNVLIDIGFKPEQLKERGPIYGPVGCDKCRGSGYKGRVGIYQVMPVSDEMKRIILRGGSSIDIADQAQKEGINDLRQSGLIKVLQGHTSIEEVLAVTNED